MSTPSLISSNAALAAQLLPSQTVAVESPSRLAARFPLSHDTARAVERYRNEVIQLVQGEGDRLLCVVGPCSIHDRRSAFEYADRLAEVAARCAGELLIAMRVYLEKPRSSVGWKGLISDPHLDGSCDIARGLWPTLATGVASTSIAYFTFLFSGVIGLAQLACFTVTGLAVAGLSTRFLLPALLDPVGRDYGRPGFLDRLNAGIARLPRAGV